MLVSKNVAVTTETFELQAIGSAVIGGASLFGGIGNPLGSLIGALTLGGL